MTSSIKDLKLGFSFILRGMKLLFTIPGAFKWAVVPFIINIILISTSLTFVLTSLDNMINPLVQMLLGDPTGWIFAIVSKIAIFLAGLVSVVLVFYIGFLISTVIASPFNSILAEKTLDHLNSSGIKPINFSGWVKITLRQLSVSLLRALVFAFIGIFIFIFSFIPILNMLAAFGAFLIVAFDCFDYSMEIKMMNLKNRLAYFRNNFTVFTGMALMLGLTLMVPGLTLLLLPCAVVGAADTMAKIDKRNT